MGRFNDELRKGAGLPPETEAEKRQREAEAAKIGGCGKQMMSAGCGLTIVSLLFLILLVLLF